VSRSRSDTSRQRESSRHPQQPKQPTIDPLWRPVFDAVVDLLEDDIRKTLGSAETREV
jgi:hypothetical protein